MNNQVTTGSQVGFGLMLQQSINFIINQKKLVQYFIIAFFLNSTIILGLQISTTFSIFVECIISCCLLYSIHQISLKQEISLKYNLNRSLIRFWGFLFCKILALLPLLITLASLVARYTEYNIDNNTLTFKQNVSMDPMLYLIQLIGLFFTANFLIAPVIYLLKPSGIIGALSIAWSNSRKIQIRALIFAIIYLFISLVLPLGLYYVLGTSLSPVLNIIISGIINALLSSFILIFSYRFFSLAYNKF